MYACGRERAEWVNSFHSLSGVCVCVFVRVCASVRMCVCVLARASGMCASMKDTYAHVSLYMYVCVCVDVHVRADVRLRTIAI